MIDDEPIVGDIVTRSLAGAATVIVAPTLAAGRQEMTSTRFDVIVCDLNLADGGAVELERDLRRLDPRLAERLIVMTGGALCAAHQQFLDAMEPRVLMKPFAAPAVRSMLAAVGGLP